MTALVVRITERESKEWCGMKSTCKTAMSCAPFEMESVGARLTGEGADDLANMRFCRARIQTILPECAVKFPDL